MQSIGVGQTYYSFQYQEDFVIEDLPNKNGFWLVRYRHRGYRRYSTPRILTCMRVDNIEMRCAGTGREVYPFNPIPAIELKSKPMPEYDRESIDVVATPIYETVDSIVFLINGQPHERVTRDEWLYFSVFNGGKQ